MTWKMPPEWAPHKQTWMGWPVNPETIDFIGSREAAFKAWAEVANTISGFEPVTMICDDGETATVRKYLNDTVTVVERELGDSWMRDCGPTFVTNEQGELGAVDWTFNGWGGRTFPHRSADALIARFVAEKAGAVHLPSKLVNEGGGIHVDGEGTLLLTETVQLNRNRNPSWTRAEVEAELHSKLGTSKAIWVPRGVMSDTSEFGTDGHIDTLVCFVKPGVVVVHGQPDSDHPDHETAKEIEAIMRAETDARGQKMEVIVLDAPEERYENGEPLSCSYINFSFVNGGVVLCKFDDPKDETTANVFRRLFNDREVVSVAALDIFKGGGGVHCITQQEPICKTSGA